MEQAEFCKTCGSVLIQKATKRRASQLKQPYYYTAYYWCPKCRKLYHDDKFKVVTGLRVSRVAASFVEVATKAEQVPRVPQAFSNTNIENARGTRDTRGTLDTLPVEI